MNSVLNHILSSAAKTQPMTQLKTRRQSQAVVRTEAHSTPYFTVRILGSRYGHLLLGMPPPYNTLAITVGFYCLSLTTYLSLQVPLPAMPLTLAEPDHNPV